MNKNIYVVDLPHDLDDQVGMVALLKKIHEGRAAGKETVIIVTGDYPSSAALAVLKMFCDENDQILPEFKGLTILTASKYVDTAPGAEADVLNPITATTITDDTMLNLFSNNPGVVDLKQDDTAVAVRLAEILQEVEDTDEVKITLCAKPGNYVSVFEQIKSKLKVTLNMQAGLAREEDGSHRLAGFNINENTSTLIRILQSHDVTYNIVDTTLAQAVPSTYNDLNNEYLRAGANVYLKNKLLQWVFKSDPVMQAIAQGDYSQVDPRLFGFALDFPRFTQKRFLSDRYGITSENCPNYSEIVADLEQAIATTRPFLGNADSLQYWESNKDKKRKLQVPKDSENAQYKQCQLQLVLANDELLAEIRKIELKYGLEAKVIIYDAPAMMLEDFIANGLLQQEQPITITIQSPGTSASASSSAEGTGGAGIEPLSIQAACFQASSVANQLKHKQYYQQLGEFFTERTQLFAVSSSLSGTPQILFNTGTLAAAAVRAPDYTSTTGLTK